MPLERLRKERQTSGFAVCTYGASEISHGREAFHLSETRLVLLPRRGCGGLADIPSLASECDSLHSRADALQKHMRTKHEEVLPPIRKTGRVTGTGAEDASMLDEHGVDSIQHPPAVVAPPTPILEAEDVDDPLIASMLLMNPHLPADEVRSLCLEERLAALTREREGLLAELTSVSNLKLAVEGCKDDDVMAVLRKEIGGDVESLLGGHMTTLVWKYSNRTSLPNLVRAAVDPLPQVADHDDDD